MTLTLFALFSIPFMLGAVVTPDAFRRTVQKLATMNNDHFFTGLFYILFAFMIFSDTGIEFKAEWKNLLGWIGIIMWLKGILWLFYPAYYVKKMKLFNEKILPPLGFLGLLASAALIYVDLKFL